MGDITKTVASTLIGVVLGSGGLGLIFKFWIEKSIKKYTNAKEEQLRNEAKRQEEYEALKDATLRLLFDAIKKAGEHFAGQGWIDPDDMREVEKLYQSYTALGGNGAGRKLHDDLMRLSSWPKKKG